MFRGIFGGRTFDAGELATFFAIAGGLYLIVAILLLTLGGDGDGGTGPRPKTPPIAPVVPDRPPAEWFSKC